MSHFLHNNSDAHLPIQGDTSDNVNNVERVTHARCLPGHLSVGFLELSSRWSLERR
jgi:hypothetical protein